MLLVDALPQSDVLQITPTIKSTYEINDKEPSNRSESQVIVDVTSYSISPTAIPLISNEPILAVSPNYILVNECTKKRKRLVTIDDKLQRFSVRSSITDVIIDALWYHIEQRFLLLTPREIFSYAPKSNSVESIIAIKADDNKLFKSFTIDNNQSLLIAYDEWESNYLDRWQENKEDGRWTLSGTYPLNFNSNEFLGMIQAINEDDDHSKIALTIYNNLTEEWRMEVRHGENGICLKTIRLPGSDPMHDYRMISMQDNQSDINWLVYSSASNQIIVIDNDWQTKCLNYKYPIGRMASFGKNNFIVRSKSKIDIYLFA